MKKIFFYVLFLYALSSTYAQCVGAPLYIWDGSAWSTPGDGSTPTINDNVIINGSYFSNLHGGSIDACSITISLDQAFFLDAGDHLNVAEDIINDGGLIFLNPESSLVQIDDNATVSGSGKYFTKVRTTTLQDADRFTYFSSPTTNDDFSVFDYENANWDYDATTQEWRFLGDGTATDAMIPGLGYAIQGGNAIAEEITFFEAYNNGVITQPLSFDVYNNVVGDFPNPAATDDDSNLVGNPYPSAISAFDLITTNNISNVYIWNHLSAVGTTIGNPWVNDDYITCTSTLCTAAPSGGGIFNGFIASGQGFFVTATDPALNPTLPVDLTFNNALRVIGNNNQFRNNNAAESLWLDITTTQGYEKQIAFTFTSNGTENFDAKFESRNLGNAYGLGFYSFNNAADKLTINDSGILINERTIPLGFYINSTTIDNATIKINHSENLEDVNIYLKDNLLNTLHDLKVDGYQMPITQTGEFNERLEIIFTKEVLNTANETLNSNLIITNQNENQIKINMLNGDIITNFKIFDTLGRLLTETKPNRSDFVVNSNAPKGQILFIKVKLESGQVLSNKFMKL
ncbi:MAG: hypothetical protein L3J23_00125 [Flavobacteriaceae bacterium]|nr:hypothetical protein [Flavobacteriaceae bacterium]